MECLVAQHAIGRPHHPCICSRHSHECIGHLKCRHHDWPSGLQTAPDLSHSTGQKLGLRTQSYQAAGRATLMHPNDCNQLYPHVRTQVINPGLIYDLYLLPAGVALYTVLIELHASIADIRHAHELGYLSIATIASYTNSCTLISQGRIKIYLANGCIIVHISLIRYARSLSSKAIENLRNVIDTALAARIDMMLTVQVCRCRALFVAQLLAKES
jgi:hypothetical protein